MKDLLNNILEDLEALAVVIGNLSPEDAKQRVEKVAANLRVVISPTDDYPPPPATPITHKSGCPAAPCSEGYYHRNQGGVNFTRVECVVHQCRTRAIGGYDPFRCTVHNPNNCTCGRPS